MNQSEFRIYKSRDILYIKVILIKKNTGNLLYN